jgi:hypothetical protein
MNKLTEANKARIEQLIPQTYLEQSDMQFMVEQYIWVLKGENVDINILKRVSPGVWRELIISQELSKLQEAYFTALGFFGENINEL